MSLLLTCHLALFAAACSGGAAPASQQQQGPSSAELSRPLLPPHTSEAATPAVAPVLRRDLAPAPPGHPSPLAVPGFAAASHVGPDGLDSWPRPVTIVLHGNFDRPEWECETWKAVAGFHGWILCPRGERTPFATLAEDRWTFRSRPSMEREIEAALTALETRYPGRVSRDKTVLAGFSLGAIHAPAIAAARKGQYPVVFLVEGGTKQLGAAQARALALAEVRGVGLAMSSAASRSKARECVRWLERSKIEAVFVDMRGAGHNYRGDFGETGRRALEKLLASLEPKR